MVIRDQTGLIPFPSVPRTRNRKSFFAAAGYGDILSSEMFSASILRFHFGNLVGKHGLDVFNGFLAVAIDKPGQHFGVVLE